MNQKTVNIISLVFMFLSIFFSMIFLIDKIDFYVDNNKEYMLFILLISELIMYSLAFFLINVIWHEFGHLLFGKIFNWHIYSFNVLGKSLFISNKKLNVVNVTLPGLAAFVEMGAKNEKQNIFLPLLGGIIFNIIGATIFAILLFNTNNSFFICVCNAFIFSNLSMAIVNSLPLNLTAITNSDMSRLLELKNLRKKGLLSHYILFMNVYDLQKKQKIENISDDMFYYNDFSNSYYLDLIHSLYIEKLIAKGSFDEAQKLINIYLKNNDIDYRSKVIFSFQLLFCMVMNNCKRDKINELFNSNIIQKNINDLESSMAIEIYSYYKMKGDNLEKESYYEKLLKNRIKNTTNKYEKERFINMYNQIKNKYDKKIK